MFGDRKQQIAFYLFYSGLLLLVVSLPLSKFAMSISQFMLIGGWLLDGNLKEKLRSFLSNKIAILLSSVYLLHVLGLLNTTDFAYAFKDLRIKLPLLLLPLIFSTAPKLSRQQFENVLLAAISGVTISTIISVLIYLGIVKRTVIDIRDISIFISHIRLVLLCCLSIFISAWLIYTNRKKRPLWYTFTLSAIMVWLMAFIVLVESLTGAAILFSGLLIFSIWIALTKGSLPVRLLFVLILVVVPYGLYRYIDSINRSFKKTEKVDYSKLEKYTASGNEYYHYPDLEDYENGFPIWTYQCETEMKVEWNKRSQLDYAGRDRKNQELRFTLMRFLSSKGLRKDSAAVWALSDSEIRSVENGIANVNYQQRSSIKARIHQSLWEIHHRNTQKNPSGHSVTQRFEYWDASIGIIKQHRIVGVGTGDVPDAFNKQYEIMSSSLTKEWRLRSHNQYLSMAVAFGIPGLIWFIFSLLMPLMIQVRKKDFLYCAFALVSIISMFTEDTLETQAGVTFFALFTSLFLFINPSNRSVGGKSDPNAGGED